MSGASDYGDFVCQIDDTVGRIMKTLNKHGPTKDTLVFFSSDNGLHGRARQENGNEPGSVMRKFGHQANGPWAFMPFTESGGPYGKHRPETTKDEKGQLFNLADDPQQRTTLWRKYPETVEELTRRLAHHEKLGHAVGLQR